MDVRPGVDMLSDVIASLRIGTTKFAQSRRAAPWGASFGPYPGAGFHLLVAGNCWLTPPNAPPLRLAAGDVVLLPHGVRHGLSDRPCANLDDLPPDHSTDSGADASRGIRRDRGHSDGGPDVDGAHLLCGAYRLERGHAHPFLRSLPDVVYLPARPGDRSAVRVAVDLLCADLAERGPGSAAALPALMDLILVYLLRAWLGEQAQRGPEAGWAAALNDAALAAALHQMHRHPQRPWTVEALAGAAGLSRTAFARRFTATVGQPPLAYLTWWRLSSGARLLITTGAPLAAVARQVGYGSEFAFATAFRRQFGVAPGRFRREQQTAPTVPVERQRAPLSPGPSGS